MADLYISENDTINYENYNYMDSTEHSNQPCSSQSSNDLGAQLSVLYYLMFVFSLVGNSLVLVVIHRFERLTTVTNILLLNLVISSLVFISSIPLIAAYLKLKKWIFGSAMCKIMGSVYYLGLYTSVLFLTLLTFDRHLAVVYPLNASHIRNRKYAFFSCAVVWIVSAVACIIPMITHKTVDSLGTTLCEQDYDNIPSAIGMKLRTTWFYLQLIMFLIFPVIVILYCYFRITITVMSSKIVSKFKTVRLILVIVLLFFISWAPFSILELMEDGTTNCVQKQRIENGIVVSRNLAYFYFCISPFFYTFVGRKFQNYFRQLLVKRFPALKKYISVNEVSRTNLSTKSTKRSLRE
uniref:G-protein coupled receptors family 1 profile domain-containing protein n=1 Tax=Oryzias latipes TaxID=8090 RepID=A0A3P9KTH1_ORYLA